MQENPQDLIRTAFTAFERGDASRAAALAGRVLEIDPGHLDALYLVGTVHATQGRYEEARGFLTRTESYAQVRRPVYGSSIGRHRPFLPYLGALVSALDPGGSD